MPPQPVRGPMPAIVCPVCEAAFPRAGDFEAHIESEHPGPHRLPYGHRA